MFLGFNNNKHLRTDFSGSDIFGLYIKVYSFTNATTCPLWTSWSPLPVVTEV
jgi:hypothetical protein